MKMPIRVVVWMDSRPVGLELYLTSKNLKRGYRAMTGPFM